MLNKQKMIGTYELWEQEIRDHTVSEALRLNVSLEGVKGAITQNQTGPLKKDGWIRPGTGVRQNDSPDF